MNRYFAASFDNPKKKILSSDFSQLLKDSVNMKIEKVTSRLKHKIFRLRVSVMFNTPMTA